MNINIEVQDIVEIHNQIIKEFGGDEGIISTSSIDFVLDYAANNTYRDEFFTIITKILQSITIDYPFVDGNKRTGIVVLEAILEDNGLILSLDENEKEYFILKVAKLEFTFESLKEFIISNCDEF